jgi:alpha-N-arabinofuranosidase
MQSMSILKKTRPLLALLLAVPAVLMSIAQTEPKSSAVLNIDVDKPLHSVSPTLYGLMTEEINFSYDGGLYAELVKNRALRDRAWSQQDWLVVQNASAGAKLEKDKTTGPSAALSDSIKLTIRAASPAEPAGLRNGGYWGYPLRPDTTYSASLYAKAANAGLGPLSISLINNKTGKSVAHADVDSIGTDWKQAPSGSISFRSSRRPTRIAKTATASI